MIIYRFQVTNEGRTESYSIDSTMKSKGCKSGYTQVETWELILDSTNRIMTSAYGSGKKRILKGIDGVKDQADSFTELQAWIANPTALKYSK